MGQLIGKTIAHYQILEQLGEGGMATVYKALDTRLERMVALKIIKIGKEQKATYLKRFELEARALARLTHPNIVRVIDYGQYDGLPFLVMAYLPGGTLADQVQQPMNYQEAARTLLPVAAALGYAHQHKIIHRDVKPGNILISRSGEPLLSDFGIAKILELDETLDLTRTGICLGTPKYMAPEQSISKEVDGRADIYSLGVVYYEMVTGRTPFKAKTPYEIMMLHYNARLPDPRQFAPDLPEAAVQVIYKALEKKPEDRFQTMEHFASALEKLAGGQTKINRFLRLRSGEKLKWLICVGILALVGVMMATGFLSFPIKKVDQVLTAQLPAALAALPEDTKTMAQKEIDVSRSTLTPSTVMTTARPTETSPATAPPTFTPTRFFLTPSAALAFMPSNPISSQNGDQISEVAKIYLGSIAYVAFSPDGKYLTANTTQGIFLRDNQSGLEQVIPNPGQAQKVAFSQDGTRLTYVGGDGNLYIWSLNQQQVVEKVFVGKTMGLAFSPDGGSLYAGGLDGILRQLGLQDNKTTLLSGHTKRVNSVVFSPDGQWIAAGSNDRTITLRDVKDSTTFKSLAGHTNIVNEVAFSPDGQLLASASDDGTVRLLDFSTGDLTRSLIIRVAVKSLSFSSDGTVLALALADGKIHLYRVNDSNRMAVLDGHSDEVTSITFSNDGLLLASGSKDGTLRLWAVKP
jgi:serine/threonine protein kinase